MSKASDFIVVITNLPDESSAQALALSLVTLKLAACVNILAPCRSIYRWNGVLETATEIPLLIKAPLDGYAALEAAILAGHPYETPEIIALPVTEGLPAYLGWVRDETGSAGT